MIYPVRLQEVGIGLGLVLIVIHGAAIFAPAACRGWLVGMPRSRAVGIVFLAVAAIWSFLLVRTMDLGEFSGLRGPILGGIVVGAVLAAIYVPEFLAVRALGMLALLAAEPLLGSAFLRPEASRLLVVCLSYAWIIAGLFWVGMPWLLRDQLSWLLSKKSRYTTAAWTGLAYGAVVLFCAAFFW